MGSALALQCFIDWAMKTQMLGANHFIEFIFTRDRNETWNEVWLAIEERALSVELQLCVKGYCWRESGAKFWNPCYENINLEINNVTGNEFLQIFWVEINILENLRKALTLQKGRIEDRKKQKTNKKKQNCREERKKAQRQFLPRKSKQASWKKAKQVSLPKKVKRLL